MRIHELAAAAILAAISTCAATAPIKSTAKAATSSALSAQSAHPVPEFGPAPQWVEKVDAPPADPKRLNDAFQFLLSDSQEYLTPATSENFVEYVIEPLNQAGLQGAGTVVIPWNVDRTTLTLNQVKIERDGKAIDALNPEDVSVIRRETKLEQSTLTGIRSVVLPVRGLRIGDKLRVAFTYRTRPDPMHRLEEIQDAVAPLQIGRVVRRMIVSKDVPVRWLVDPAVKQTRLKSTADAEEREFIAENVEPLKDRKFVPERFKHEFIQVSSFANWNEVAQLIEPLFEEARKTAPDSAVSVLAQKIAAAHAEQQDRMLAALRTSQDDIRYVALLLNDGEYRPTSADKVWAQRFGDCKGKTAFLLALLDKLGIKAEPVLASVGHDDGLDQRLPSLGIFDHVLVRAHIGLETYYLDGTHFGQRTLEELKQSPVIHVLPLTANATLVTTPDITPALPLSETLLVWDARQGVTGDVPFQATLTLRDSSAEQARTQALDTMNRDKFIEKLKDKVNGVPNNLLELVSIDAEQPDGSFVARFKGTATLDWSPVEGLKGNRLQLTQSQVSWDGEFDRDDDAGKTIPVSMAFPFWERTTEKVLLPDGGREFRIDASPIDQTVAATRITRSVTMADGIVTSVSDFRRLGRELDAADARSAKSTLDKISNNFAYVVARRKLKIATND